MDFINIDTIKIPKAFTDSKPKKNKIEKIRNYCQKNGHIDKPIVIRKNGKGSLLVDGYIRYLVAKELGYKTIPFIFEDSLYSQHKYIYGKFKSCDKLYIWKVKDSIDVKVNDTVVVQSKKSKGIVTVVDIFTLDGMKNVYYYAKHRDVIKVCKEGSVCNATK